MTERTLLVIEDESRLYPPYSAYQTEPYVHRKGPDKGERSRYDLFFTDSRIIAAVVVSTYDLPPLIMFYEDFKPAREWKKIRTKRRQQFKNNTPDEILHLHPESFEIRYENIQEIKLIKGILKRRLIVKLKIDKKIYEKIFPIPKSRCEELETFIHNYLKFSAKFFQIKKGKK